MLQLHHTHRFGAFTCMTLASPTDLSKSQLKRWSSVAPFERLVFTKCDIWEEDIASLQEVVTVDVLGDAT